MKFRLSQKASQWLTSSIATLSMISLLPTSMALLSATTVQAEANSSALTLMARQPVTGQAISTRLPSRVRNAVLQAHARQFRVPINQLRVISFSRESWSDTCLGLGRPEEGCGLAMVDGWRVEVGHGASRWFYRTDSTGRNLRIEDMSDAGSVPEAIRQKALEIASLDSGLSMNQLKIVAGRPQLWDGCLGVAGANGLCTRIGIPGWQVIVASQQQYWVYHLNQNATMIKRNPTTSGRGTVVPSFWQPDASMVPAKPEEILFQSVTSGGIAGQAYKTLLQRDGRVLRIDLRQQSPKGPTLIRQLTPRQVRAFVQTLQQNEIEDFMGFNYSPVAGADYFTIAFVAPGSKQGVQYADIVQDQTPPKLQQIIQAWNRITNPNRR